MIYRIKSTVLKEQHKRMETINSRVAVQMLTAARKIDPLARMLVIPTKR